VKHHSSDKFEENTEYNYIYIILSFGSTFYRLFMKHVHKRSRRKNNFKKQKKTNEYSHTPNSTQLTSSLFPKIFTAIPNTVAPS